MLNIMLSDCSVLLITKRKLKDPPGECVLLGDLWWACIYATGAMLHVYSLWLMKVPLHQIFGACCRYQVAAGVTIRPGRGRCVRKTSVRQARL